MNVTSRVRSTWPTRRTFDRSKPQLGQTLSVDRPLFGALIHRLDFLQTVKRMCTIRHLVVNSRASAVLQSNLIATKFGTTEAQRLNWA